MNRPIAQCTFQMKEEVTEQGVFVVRSIEKGSRSCGNMAERLQKLFEIIDQRRRIR